MDEAQQYSLFREAVAALDAGDTSTLAKLIGDHPFLLSYRCRQGEWYDSGYFAGATLMNHIAGNPIRVPLPKKIIEVTELLISAGAGVKDNYTVGLLLTSHQASVAGVALPLIDLLVRAGAKVDLNDPCLMTIALENQAPETAAALLERGAKPTLAHLAGLGKLEEMRTFGPCTSEELGEAFVLGCAYGQTECVRALLDLGADTSCQVGTGQPGFHRAVINGHIETVKLLLDRKVDLSAKNVYGGTVLGQARWCIENEPNANHTEIIQLLTEAGAA